MSITGQGDVARELAEELRTNTRLRHRLGMSEGTDSGVMTDGEQTHLYITTDEGQAFAIGITQVEEVPEQ